MHAQPIHVNSDQLYLDAHKLAEEEVLYLRDRHKMAASEIIMLYTGKPKRNASYIDAIRSIREFNLSQAKMQGFLAL